MNNANSPLTGIVNSSVSSRNCEIGSPQAVYSTPFHNKEIYYSEGDINV